MRDWKGICKKLLFPPIWVTVLMTVLCTVALVSVFVKEMEAHPVAYVVYVLSFYTLSVICVACYFTLPGYYKAVKRKMYEGKYTGRYMTDAVYKTQVSLYCSLGFNLLYVAFHTVSAIWYHTAWFGILAGYYAILAIMRFLLVRYVNRHPIGQNRLEELKRARLCAIILLLVNLSLSSVVLMIMYQDRGYEYHGIFIYVMAAYTFYITTSAIIHLVKYRKYKSPIMSMTKVIKFAAALVSMLALETAMFAQFGQDMSPENQRIMVAATGAGISITVVAMAIYMIVRCASELKTWKINNT